MNEETPTFEQAKAMLAEKVRMGAELLDRERPRWAHRINTECLRLRSVSHCVLGQLYGGNADQPNGYEEGLSKLQHVLPEEREMGAAYGFALPVAMAAGFEDSEAEALWAHMDDLWTEEVRRRLPA